MTLWKKAILVLLPLLLLGSVVFVAKPWLDRRKEQAKYDFTLESLGGTVTPESFRGKALLLYFGYTYCPDICPTSMGSISVALGRLEPELAERTAVLFVSVDPERDGLEHLDRYVKYFVPSAVGATAELPVIEEMGERYGSSFSKVPLENSAMGYSVAHTSYIYLFSPEGRFLERLDHAFDPAPVEAALRRALTDK